MPMCMKSYILYVAAIFLFAQHGIEYKCNVNVNVFPFFVFLHIVDQQDQGSHPCPRPAVTAGAEIEEEPSPGQPPSLHPFSHTRPLALQSLSLQSLSQFNSVKSKCVLLT